MDKRWVKFESVKIDTRWVKFDRVKFDSGYDKFDNTILKVDKLNLRSL